MRRFLLAVAAIAALAAVPARADPQFPTIWPGINAPGAVIMCPTTAGNYAPCGSPTARPLPFALQNTPNFVPQQPAGVWTAIASGTTGAVTATAALVPGKTLYICGFDVSAIGGTAAVGPITVTGLLGGTFTYQLASTATGVTLPKLYTPCIPAASPSTAIAVVTTADGTASAVNVQLWGVAQ
jgi:hypothetical protein